MINLWHYSHQLSLINSGFEPLTKHKFNPKSAGFILWIAMDTMYIIFALYFLIIYCKQRKTFRANHKHLKESDKEIIQKLRFSAVILCILGLLWPLKHYLTDPPQIFLYISYVSIALFDLLLMLMIVTVSKRIFQSYYDVSPIRKMPVCYSLLLGLYFWAWILAEVLYTLSMLNRNDMILKTLWKIYLYAFGFVFLFFMLFILMTCCHIFGYNRGLNINSKIRPLNRVQMRDKQLFKRITHLSIGLVLYSINIISAILYIFIKALISWEIIQNYDITDSIWWRIQFNFIAHFIALFSFWCYLRPWKDEYSLANNNNNNNTTYIKLNNEETVPSEHASNYN